MRTTAPLVGRRDELARLHAVLGHGGLGGDAALVIAEAGAGKTRLITEAVQATALAPDRVLHVRGGELSATLPFVALRRGLRPLVGDDERIAALFGDYRTVGSATARAELIDAFAGSVERRAFDGPLVLVVDDAHWVDDASLAVIDLLARQLESVPLKLVLASRPHPEPVGLAAVVRTLHRSDRLDRIELRPLSDAASRRITEHLIGGPAGPSVRALVERAGGNALYCTELGLALRDHVSRHPDGSLELHGDDAAIGLDVIEHNLAALGDDCRRVLADAALLGTSVEPHELALVLDTSVTDLVDRARPALRAGILIEDEDRRLRFRHDLVRDAVLAAVPHAVAAERHRDVALALRAAGLPPPSWVGHLRLADWTGHTDAWALFKEAADAMGRHSLTGAAQLLDHALATLDGDPPLTFVSAQLERLVQVDRVDELRVLAESVLRRDPSSLDISHEEALTLGYRLFAARWWTMGRLRDLDVTSWLEGLSASFPPATPLVEVDRLTHHMLVEGSPDAVEATEAVAHRARDDGDEPLELIAMENAAYGALVTRQPVRAVGLWLDSAAIKLRTGANPWLLVDDVYMATIWDTRDGPAHEWFTKVAAIGERLGPPSSMAVHLLHATRLVREGQWAAATRLIDGVVEADRGLYLPAFGRATIPVRTYAGAGRHDDALRLLDALNVPTRSSPLAQLLRTAVHHRDRAIASLLAGRPAADHIERAAHAWAECGPPYHDRMEPALWAAVAALAGCHDLVALLDGLAAHADRMPAWDRAVTAELAGRTTDAEDPARRALTEHEFAVAEALAANRDDDAAIPLLHESHQRAVAAGADGWRDRLERALAARGERSVPPPPTRTGLAGLTPAEQRVLPLILDGLLYREIAEELHNSRRTIESHAASIMRKLGVSSRRELTHAIDASKLVAH